ncbi:MAG: phage tail protein, partial [Bacillota bacterium]|nr:phage tail protein [Bacillota bacterium]
SGADGFMAKEDKAKLDGIETGANKVPPGVVVPYGGSTPPSGWLECDGAAVSRTAYAALFAAIGTIWGAGDGSTTFNLPDLRAEFIRGWDHGRGVDPGRTLGSYQADEFKSHSHTIWRGQAIGNSSTGSYNGDNMSFDGISGATGGSETRPRNAAPMFIIKY